MKTGSFVLFNKLYSFLDRRQVRLKSLFDLTQPLGKACKVHPLYLLLLHKG